MTVHSIGARNPRGFARTAVLATLLLAACGGGSEQSFSTCGNGRIDSGETCDDGNTTDGDACTSACRPARCGDGVRQVGVEACDQLDLGADCAALGLDGGRPACLPSCEIDPSPCGPAFTPSATPTQTPTPAPPTPTPTSTPRSQCGDGLLSDDETCDSCPADCVAPGCDASGTIPVGVRIVIPSGVTVTQVAVSLAYRTSIVGLPNATAELRARVQPATGIIVPPPTEKDYAVDLRAARTAGLASGDLLTMTFDRCAGAPTPVGSDFSCLVTACGSATGCSCSATPQ